MGFHLARSKYHGCVQEKQFYGSVSDSIYLVLNKFLNLTVCAHESKHVLPLGMAVGFSSCFFLPICLSIYLSICCIMLNRDQKGIKDEKDLFSFLLPLLKLFKIWGEVSRVKPSSLFWRTLGIE